MGGAGRGQILVAAARIAKLLAREKREDTHPGGRLPPGALATGHPHCRRGERILAGRLRRAELVVPVPVRSGGSAGRPGDLLCVELGWAADGEWRTIQPVPAHRGSSSSPVRDDGRGPPRRRPAGDRAHQRPRPLRGESNHRPFSSSRGRARHHPGGQGPGRDSASRAGAEIGARASFRAAKSRRGPAIVPPVGERRARAERSARRRGTVPAGIAPDRWNMDCDRDPAGDSAMLPMPEEGNLPR
jgi:hypothetical protein